jgi:hypothetical protein
MNYGQERTGDEMTVVCFKVLCRQWPGGSQETVKNLKTVHDL